MRLATGFIGWCTAVLVAAPAASAACADEDLRPDAANLARIKAAVVCLHNEERKASGVPSLRPNPLLEVAASSHSADMVARRYFEHDTPDGFDPFERMRRAGYIKSGAVWNAGENIGWASGALATPRSIFAAWMKSYGHRLTLLASDFTELGVGISLGAPSEQHAALPGTVTYTIDFGWRQRAAQKRCPARAGKAKPRPALRGARATCR